MRFRRSASAPANSIAPRRSRRKLFLLGFAILAAGAVVGDRAWTRANGVVAGELTAVSPIAEARLQKLFVNCLDHVVKGQRVAEFDNEATVEGANQLIQQLELLRRQALAESDIAKSQSDAARKVVEAQTAELQQAHAVLKAESDLVKKQFVANLVWQNAQATVIRAEADKAAAEFIYESKQAEQAKAAVSASVLTDRINSLRASAELTGHFYLTAPKDGTVTECTAHEGEVVAAKSTIFQIFNPDDAYAIVFFDPSDIARLQFGQDVALQVTGFAAGVHGRVGGFYPELSALPSALTRYFWQQERWSQYAPVRVNFDGLQPQDKARLVAWAQLSVSYWQWPPGWAEYYRQWVDRARPWVQRYFGPSPHLLAESQTVGR